MFKEIFIKLIQKKQISGYQLSKDTGISETLISQWKSGRQLPKYDNINTLCDYFGCSADYLLGRTDNPEISTSTNLSKLHIYPYNFYEVPASAGTGMPLDYSTCKIIELKNKAPDGTDYIIPIGGDSMEPTYLNGDCVFVQKTTQLTFGDIGIFFKDGNVYIKEYSKKGLKSLNPKYPIIPCDENVTCLGKVLGKVNEKF